MKYQIPEQIESKRLLLRKFKDADWKGLHEYYSNIETTRFTVGKVLSEGEAWRAMASMVGHWELRKYGPYALEEKETGKVIGIAGLWYPNDWPEPEIKWGLATQYHGKGYASEAARAVQKMTKEYLPNTKLISFIINENKASIKLALAIGCIFEKEVPFRGAQWSLYRHP